MSIHVEAGDEPRRSCSEIARIPAALEARSRLQTRRRRAGRGDRRSHAAQREAAAAGDRRDARPAQRLRRGAPVDRARGGAAGPRRRRPTLHHAAAPGCCVAAAVALRRRARDGAGRPDAEAARRPRVRGAPPRRDARASTSTSCRSPRTRTRRRSCCAARPSARSPASRAIVLARNNSDDRLEPKTSLERLPELREPLAGATPRSCLAVRLGRGHDESPSPTRCSAARSAACCPAPRAASRCWSSGEVIGSVLINVDDAARARTASASARPSPRPRRCSPTCATSRSPSCAPRPTRSPACPTSARSRTRSSAWSRRPRGPSARWRRCSIDLDHFKQINDIYGHDRGDEVLAAVGVALGNVVRESDFVGRYGGEEFLLLLPSTDRDGALHVAEAVRTAIAAISVPRRRARRSPRASASPPCPTTPATPSRSSAPPTARSTRPRTTAATASSPRRRRSRAEPAAGRSSSPPASERMKRIASAMSPASVNVLNAFSGSAARISGVTSALIATMLAVAPEPPAAKPWASASDPRLGSGLGRRVGGVVLRRRDRLLGRHQHEAAVAGALQRAVERARRVHGGADQQVVEERPVLQRRLLQRLAAAPAADDVHDGVDVAEARLQVLRPARHRRRVQHVQRAAVGGLDRIEPVGRDVAERERRPGRAQPARQVRAERAARRPRSRRRRPSSELMRRPGRRC